MRAVYAAIVRSRASAGPGSLVEFRKEVLLLELGVKTLLAYLLGSVIGSLVMGRFRGVDIRELGSGNAGGTNALRTQGWKFAVGVFAIDVGKALLAVGVLPALDLPFVGIDATVDRDWLAVACAIAVVIGHV
jgi:acyl phosphate:glycerol-3-phosphate acyltransferase